MLHRNLSAKVAVILLILHGSIEILGLVFISSIPNTLISFSGLTGSLLEQHTQTVGMFGALWGIARLIAVVGAWSLQKWAIILGIILSPVTILAAISIFPAGVTDTFLAMPVLILLLYTWFGNDVIHVKGV
jgi:hypothetical protein